VNNYITTTITIIQSLFYLCAELRSPEANSRVITNTKITKKKRQRRAEQNI
jgi:hypothetical protein